SWAIICCVRTDSVAAVSDGSPSASSKELACRLWVPPRTALIDCSATRTMLLYGCCAVSVLPPVWVWKRSACARASFTPYRSFIRRAQIVRAARNLATSSKKSEKTAKKNDSRGANSAVGEDGKEERQPGRKLGHRQAGGPGGVDVGDSVRHR